MATTPIEFILLLFSIILHYIAHDAISLSEDSIHMILHLMVTPCVPVEFSEIYVCTYSERSHICALKIDKEAGHNYVSGHHVQIKWRMGIRIVN
jgi:hypothetical protein